jgi:hypothetical protein
MGRVTHYEGNKLDQEWDMEKHWKTFCLSCEIIYRQWHHHRRQGRAMIQITSHLLCSEAIYVYFYDLAYLMNIVTSF